MPAAKTDKPAKIILPEAGLLKLVPIKGKGRGVITTTRFARYAAS